MRAYRAARIAFRMVCLLFSIAFALLTLRCGIALTAQGERIEVLEQQERALLEENVRLRVRTACAIDMEELEEYVTRVLGMQPCQSDQIYVVHDMG